MYYASADIIRVLFEDCVRCIQLTDISITLFIYGKGPGEEHTESFYVNFTVEHF